MPAKIYCQRFNLLSVCIDTDNDFVLKKGQAFTSTVNDPEQQRM